MSDQVLVTRSYLEDTGDAIREKLETDLAYTPAEFGAAIRSIEGGITPTGTIQITTNGTHDVTEYADANVNVSAEPVVQSLSVTQNGTYTPPSGVDGYAPVTVNVSGGGGNTVLCEVDFTKASFTLNNVVYDTTGATFSSVNGSIIVPFARSGMTIELDVASMSLSSGSHRRFIMANSDSGLIYRSTGVWAIYAGSSGWEESTYTDGSLFNNSTVKVFIDSSNKWHIYKNDVLIWEPNSALPIAVSYAYIGSSGYSINNAVLTGMRVY